MAPTKKQFSSPKRLKQTTLFGLYDSSPPCPRKNKRASPSKALATLPVRSKRKRKRGSSPVFDASQTSGDEDGADSSSDVGAIKFEPEVIEVSDEEQHSPLRSAAKKRKTIVESDDEAGAPDIDDGGADNEELVRVLGNTKGRGQWVNDSEEEEESQPRRHKLLKGRPPTANYTDDESDEVDQDQILDTRLRERGKKTSYQKGLEKLKRRKQGKKAVKSESEAEDEEEGDEDDIITPFKGARPDNDNDSEASNAEEEDSQEDDFIVEDDDATPAELPMEFSMDTHQDLVHQFKKIFQFFVHIAVQPPEERQEYMEHQMKNEQYFSVPLQIFRRKLSGLRDSLVASSVWRPDFKKPLEKYPDFELNALQFAMPLCDACHLGGRLSTLMGRLGGKPYNPSGFEDVYMVNDFSDSDDDTEDQQSTIEFHLGRFCAKRTQVFHKFTHWEYALFRSISREVEELQVGKGQSTSRFVRVAYVGGSKPPEDLTDADGICDWLDQRRVIDMEWQTLKDMMESARHLEMAVTKGQDGDDF